LTALFFIYVAHWLRVCCNELTDCTLFVGSAEVVSTRKTLSNWHATISLGWMLHLVALRYCGHCKKSTASHQWPHIADRWLFAQVCRSLFVLFLV